jgi:hypothetical protein
LCLLLLPIRCHMIVHSEPTPCTTRYQVQLVHLWARTYTREHQPACVYPDGERGARI